MEAAAKHLTPVTLELGGKTPCIVDSDIQVEYTAKRIAWGKFINAGQTCIAPDYLLVDKKVKPALMQAIKTAIHGFYGDDPQKSPDYSRIINQHHLGRLAEFIKDGEVVVGGQTNPEDKYIAPTVLDKVSWDAPVMKDEIFGPILPVLEYDDFGEAIAQINARPKPLALYLFSKDKEKQERVLRETSSGGVCLNDTVMQVGSNKFTFWRSWRQRHRHLSRQSKF
jgi:aldehyde dehydrogenase (NAD+)